MITIFDVFELIKSCRFTPWVWFFIHFHSFKFRPLNCSQHNRKMKKAEEEIIDIYYTIKPIKYFATFCGLWPHTLKVSWLHPSRFELSLNFNLMNHRYDLCLKRSSPGIGTASLLWFFCVFATYIYMFYFNLDKSFWDSFGLITNSKFQMYGTWVQVLSGLAIGKLPCHLID